MATAYIVAAARTAVGRAGGVFRDVRPDDLLAHAIQGVLTKVPEITADEIGDVIIGCAMPEAEQGMNVARMASLLAGLPDTVTAMTINRFCSSGLQAIALAVDQIALGNADVMLAGGVESMSMVPIGGNKFTANPKMFTSDALLGMAHNMGITAETVASRWQISREQQDDFALRSHQRAIAALKDNLFAEEILPMTVVQHLPHLNEGGYQSVAKTIRQDEGPRADTSLAVLAKLPTVFAKNGHVTAGNSSQRSDGAAALLIVSERYLKQKNLTPLARFCGYSVAGVPPDVMGIGPIAAIPKVLKQTGIQLSDIEWIELNEAFAAQTLAVMQSLDLNADLVNPLGGAIALGHPLGATGAVRSATLIHGMRRLKQRYGMVTMCIGTGMGAAGIFEVM